MGGAAGSGHRLQCPASLVNKLVEACGPPCRTRSIRKPETEAAIALMRKVQGRSGDGFFGSRIAFWAYCESAYAQHHRVGHLAFAPGAAR